MSKRGVSDLLRYLAANASADWPGLMLATPGDSFQEFEAAVLPSQPETQDDDWPLISFAFWMHRQPKMADLWPDRDDLDTQARTWLLA